MTLPSVETIALEDDIEVSPDTLTASVTEPTLLGINDVDTEGLYADYTYAKNFLENADLESPILYSDLPEEFIASVGSLLEMHDVANEAYFYMESRPHEYVKTRLFSLWDGCALEQRERLGKLLNIGSGTLAREQFLEEKPISQGMEIVQQLLISPDFKHKKALSEYIMQEGWAAKRAFFRVDPRTDANRYQQERFFYEFEKSTYNSLLEMVSKSLVEEGNYSQVRKVFEHLAFSELPEDNIFEQDYFPSADDISKKILLGEGFTFSQHREVLKEYIKVYGPIRAVDILAAGVVSLKEAGAALSDPKLKRLVDLYSLIEGEDVPEEALLEKLVDVYDLVNYADLERPELTQKEADMLEEVVTLFANFQEYSTINGLVKKLRVSDRIKTGKNEGSFYERISPKEVTILDIGAGNARVSRELYKRGYRNVIALDYDPKNVSVANERRPDSGFRVVRADWHKFPFKTAGKEYLKQDIKVGFTAERSFMHNRTPSEWFMLFDEYRRVSHPRAFLFLDIPDLEDGVYKERVDRFSSNLQENLGITENECKIIFDGPGKVKFNRMAITEEQLKIYAKLFGFVVVDEPVRDRRDGEDMTDVYYTLAKDQNFVFGDIGRNELLGDLESLGMLNYQVDYNMFVESWGMTLGQALVFGPDYAGSLSSSPKTAADFKAGMGPRVWADKKGGKLNLKVDYPRLG